ncbi:MAG: hypothetical protein GF317_15435 [Candidatus Lokiarchaeota archaeon]|nr:hypothetical protein [Candidatus Lokiarchaeota archaeon]MBD3200958.1 hypothetical protein [Candidatus Lokiarchaeota archaeon]
MKKKLNNIIRNFKLSLFLHSLIPILSVILLLLRTNFMYIRHNSFGFLKIIIYVFYENWQLLPFYLLIALALINLATILFIYNEPFRKVILSVTPLITAFSMVSIIISPEILIFSPLGEPPTKLISLELGGYFYMGLSTVFIFSSLYTIKKLNFLKPYFYNLALLIGVFFISSFIHENGHAFFIILSGGKITGYAPFPFLDLNNFAGYVSWQGVPQNLIPLVMMGGEIFQWNSILIIGSLLFFKRFNPWISRFLIMLIIIAWLDFPLYSINNTFGIPHWFVFGSSSGDIVEFAYELKIDILFFNIIAIAQLSMGIFLIYFKLFKDQQYQDLLVITKDFKKIENLQL